jgi:hypothetical protein
MTSRAATGSEISQQRRNGPLSTATALRRQDKSMALKDVKVFNLFS